MRKTGWVGPGVRQGGVKDGAREGSKASLWGGPRLQACCSSSSWLWAPWLTSGSGVVCKIPWCLNPRRSCLVPLCSLSIYWAPQQAAHGSRVCSGHRAGYALAFKTPDCDLSEKTFIPTAHLSHPQRLLKFHPYHKQHPLRSFIPH